MMALFHREMTGEGQHVDLSAQESVYWASQNLPEFWDLQKVNLKREGMWRPFGMIKMRWLYPCKDGYINTYTIVGAAAPPGLRRLRDWMDSEGMCPDWMREVDFSVVDAAAMSPERAESMAEAFANFYVTKTKAELLEKAMEWGIFLAPISDAKDLAENPQLKERGFWVEVEYPELGATITYPGAALKITETPMVIRRRAPLIGEHNEDIYEKELGLSKEKLTMLKGASVI
jgi:crotonobetainyl-CoA:carnitine CoA-transferase CaiB-like acyl-CoA transferase